MHQFELVEELSKKAFEGQKSALTFKKVIDELD